MPAPLAPLVAFALGVLFAWLARVPVAPDEPAWDRPTLAVSLYALLVYGPVSAYFVVFASDWSFAYLVDGRSVPSAVGLLLVLLDVAALPAGFIVARRAQSRHALAALGWLAGLPLLVTAGTLVGLHARFGIDATYDQVQSDFGIHPLPGSPLGYAILWMDALLAAGAVATTQALTARTTAPLGLPPRAPLAPAPPPPPERATAATDEPQKRLLGRGRRSP